MTMCKCGRWLTTMASIYIGACEQCVAAHSEEGQRLISINLKVIEGDHE